MKRTVIRGLATTLLLSGGLGLAGLGLAGTAQADYGPHQWCPGQSMAPGQGGPGNEILWDMNVCHTWYQVGYAQGNVANRYSSNPTSIWDGDNPPVPPPPQCGAPGQIPCGLLP